MMKPSLILFILFACFTPGMHAQAPLQTANGESIQNPDRKEKRINGASILLPETTTTCKTCHMNAKLGSQMPERPMLLNFHRP